ncbi:MAG: sulfotransferase domain-containing protein [Bryobacteraceae bacterium]
MPAVFASAVRPRYSHLVIKSHTLDESRRQFCRNGAVKTIYTWRNPFDVVVSCMRMWGFSFERSVGALREALKVWSFHRETNSACILSYDMILTQPPVAIAIAADYLGLPVEPNCLSRIAADLSFDNMKRLSRQIDQLNPNRLAQKDEFVFDRETLLHQDHIRNGGIGFGVEILDEIQTSNIDHLLRDEGFAFLCKSPSAA